MAYAEFSRFYDSLMKNADYEKRADYYEELLKRNGVSGGILLDLGCGTGEMSSLMAQKGFSVIGVDVSVDMLMAAREKAALKGQDILFLNQDMTALDLYGTVNATVSVMDCINHLSCFEDVKKTFAAVSLFTEPGGVFAFDVNTVYKHRFVLADNTFVYDNDDVYCVWQNSANEDDSVDVYLDFFEKSGDKYVRTGENFTERAYPLEMIAAALDESGFEVTGIYDDMTFENAGEKSEKAVFTARKR